VLAFGTPAIAACEAADELSSEYRVAVYDARFAKPVDETLVRSLLSRGIPVLTIEDHSIVGGFGSAVLECAQEHGLDASRVVRHGIPDHWILQDSRPDQLKEVGLDRTGIMRMIRHAADPSAHDRVRVETANERLPSPTPTTERV
ncbi:MAG: hypothetical protein KC996_08550, partial [Phycisphaerales bacterium]|nr:hypothetical protein [Phycisphaerales bacterium]